MHTYIDCFISLVVLNVFVRQKLSFPRLWEHVRSEIGRYVSKLAKTHQNAVRLCLNLFQFDGGAACGSPAGLGAHHQHPKERAKMTCPDRAESWIRGQS